MWSYVGHTLSTSRQHCTHYTFGLEVTTLSPARELIPLLVEQEWRLFLCRKTQRVDSTSRTLDPRPVDVCCYVWGKSPYWVKPQERHRYAFRLLQCIPATGSQIKIMPAFGEHCIHIWVSGLRVSIIVLYSSLADCICRTQ